VAGNIFGASDASRGAFSNGGKREGTGESGSFFVRFRTGAGVSGATSLALRLRCAFGGLVWGIEADDTVETKAREAPLVLGGMLGNKWVAREDEKTCKDKCRDLMQLSDGAGMLTKAELSKCEVLNKGSLVYSK
jgi:hypothetical protein